MSWAQAGFLAFLLIAGTVGCSRKPVQASEDSSPQEQLPFDRPADKAGFSPTGLISARGIPAGTPVTIRLRSSVSSQNSKPGDLFEAVLDEPILVNGQMIIAPGAAVSGKVLQVEPAASPRESGYLRLTLTSITDRGRSLGLETATVFLKASRPQATDEPGVASSSQLTGAEVTLPVDHRLTFRLTRLVQLPG
jgi:hypothetical protein